jgi:hypothetical protein
MSVVSEPAERDPSGMKDFLHLLFTAPEHRYANNVGYSVDMISAIAHGYDDAVDRGDFLAAAAMVDAFYVHIRLLGDFLVRDTNKNDFGPAELGVTDWTPPTTDEAKRLNECWVTASKYVVHFGRPRVPENLSDLQSFDVNGAAFRGMARDALTVFALFLRDLLAVTPAWAGGARVPDRDREPREFETRLLFERTERMRKSFVEACAKVGLDGSSLLA